MRSGKKTVIFIVCGVIAVLAGLFYLLLGDRLDTAEPVIKPVVTLMPAKEDNSADTADTAETSVREPPYTGSETVTETITRVTAVFPLDINYASAEELALLDGIGETIAKRIIAYRNEHGFFRSAEELLKVKGIGKSKLENIIDCIYVDESLMSETTTAAVSAASESGRVSETTKVTETEKRGKKTEKTHTSTVTVSVEEKEDLDDDIIIDDITEFTDFDEYIDDEDDSVYTSTVYRPNFPLELNTASARDLACIDGIGDVIAARIVEYARLYGFYDVNDLLNVSGIGQSKLQGIIPYVYADPSGLPPRTETTVSSAYNYDPFGYMTDYTSYTSDWGYTQTQAPQIYAVNVNTGSKADFMQLPGIDEALAESIISFRSQIGGFEKLEELLLADGMTNSKLSAIWDYIYL